MNEQPPAKTAQSDTPISDKHAGYFYAHRHAMSIFNDMLKLEKENSDLKARAEKAEYDKEQAINREAEMMAAAQGLQQQLSASEQARKEAEEHDYRSFTLNTLRKVDPALDAHMSLCERVIKKNEELEQQLAASREGKGWIACSERMPTKEDADIDGRITWIRFHDGKPEIAKWNFCDSPQAYMTHWLNRDLPQLPSAPEPEHGAWTLPEPPSGMEWHRKDFTQEMLPPGWRPLLKGELVEKGDESCARAIKWGPSCNWSSFGGELTDGFWYRTRRPLPEPPRVALEAKIEAIRKIVCS